MSKTDGRVMRELLERVKGACEGAFLLNVAIGQAVEPDINAAWPDYSRSIDAAVALMERVLPGWDIHFYPEGDGQPGYVAELDWPPEAPVGDAGYFGINGRARTRALAIVAAVLEARLTLSERPALIAQEATDA